MKQRESQMLIHKWDIDAISSNAQGTFYEKKIVRTM